MGRAQGLVPLQLVSVHAHGHPVSDVGAQGLVPLDAISLRLALRRKSRITVQGRMAMRPYAVVPSMRQAALFVT